MTKLLTITAACLLISIPCNVFAQTDLIQDVGREEPRVMMSDATFLILTMGAFGGLLVSPGEKAESAKSWFEAEELDKPLEVGNAYGSGWGVGSLGLLTFAYGELFSDQEAQNLGSDLMVSFVTTTAFSSVLKYTVNRTRPDGGDYSFPSGHTSGAFSSVLVMWHHLGWETGVTFAVLSTATGMARVKNSRHYRSDVIAGAALGLAIGHIVSSRRDDDGWRVAPHGTGLSLSHDF